MAGLNTSPMDCIKHLWVGKGLRPCPQCFPVRKEVLPSAKPYLQSGTRVKYTGSIFPALRGKEAVVQQYYVNTHEYVLRDQCGVVWTVPCEHVKPLLSGIDGAWDAPEPQAEYTGGASSYYAVEVRRPTKPDAPKYTAECNDIIEALGMNFAEGNAFKALWRRAAARQGRLKKGYTDGLYDAEKVVFFGNRLIEQEKELNAHK